MVVNAVGSAVDPVSGRLWADRTFRLATPDDKEADALHSAWRQHRPALATTLGVLLTDLALTKAQAAKVAAVAHDGLARAVRPVHSMTDGDTIFCLASDRRVRPADPRADQAVFDELLTAAADVFTDACLDALVSATGRGTWSSYLELAPSVAVGR